MSLGELYIYVVNLAKAKKVEKDTNIGIHLISQTLPIEDFARVAKALGTVYTLSEFLQKVNDNELNNFSNTFVRGAIVYQDLIVEEFWWKAY